MQPVGGSWQRRVLGCLGTFADLSLGLLVVKAMTGVLLGPSCTQPGPAQEATSKRPGPGRSSREFFQTFKDE